METMSKKNNQASSASQRRSNHVIIKFTMMWWSWSVNVTMLRCNSLGMKFLINGKTSAERR